MGLVALHAATAATATATAPVTSGHWYFEWGFWQGAVALLALVLTQLPPLKTFLRPGRLKIDLASQMFVTHTFGNSNINLLVGLRNTGAREVRVRSLSMVVKRAGGESFRLDAHNFENPGDKNPYLLVPFTIRPRENWLRHYLFFKDIDRQMNKEISASVLAVKRQIRERRAMLSHPNSPENVSVDDALVKPFLDVFEKQFQWLAGEYEIQLSVEAEPRSASLHKAFRFVLFESDTEQLRDHVLEYSTGGGGIQWTGDRALGVFPYITEVP